jgi:hypothetical protein
MHPTPAVFIVFGAFMKFKKMKKDPLSRLYIRTSPLNDDELGGGPSFKKQKARYLKNRKYMAKDSMTLSHYDDLYSREETPDNKNFKKYLKTIKEREEGPLLYRVFRYAPDIFDSPFPEDVFNSRGGFNILCELSCLYSVFNGILEKIVPLLLEYSGSARSIAKLKKIEKIQYKDFYFCSDDYQRDKIWKIIERLSRIENYLTFPESDPHALPLTESPFAKAITNFRLMAQAFRDITEYFSTTPDPRMLRATVATMEIVGLPQDEDHFRGNPKGLLHIPAYRSVEIFREPYGAGDKLGKAIEGLIKFIWYLEECLACAIPETPEEEELLYDLKAEVFTSLNEIIIDAVLDCYPENSEPINIDSNSWLKRNPDLADLIEHTGLSYNIDNTANRGESEVSYIVDKLAYKLIALTGVDPRGTTGEIASRALKTYEDTDLILDMLQACFKDCFKIIKSHK